MTNKNIIGFILIVATIISFINPSESIAQAKKEKPNAEKPKSWTCKCCSKSFTSDYVTHGMACCITPPHNKKLENVTQASNKKNIVIDEVVDNNNEPIQAITSSPKEKHFCKCCNKNFNGSTAVHVAKCCKPSLSENPHD